MLRYVVVGFVNPDRAILLLCVASGGFLCGFAPWREACFGLENHANQGAKYSKVVPLAAVLSRSRALEPHAETRSARSVLRIREHGAGCGTIPELARGAEPHAKARRAQRVVGLVV